MGTEAANGTYTQAGRPLTVTLPEPLVGRDDLLLVGFTGSEVISQLFRFQLDLVAPNDRATSR